MFPTDQLERVREGMDVFNVNGQRLGKVVRVEVATAAPTRPPDSDLLEDMSEDVPSPPDMTDLSSVEAVGVSPLGHDPLALPDLPEPFRDHLQSVGFIEVEGIDLTDAQRFVAADHIREVDKDRVVVEAGPQSGAVD